MLYVPAYQIYIKPLKSLTKTQLAENTTSSTNISVWILTVKLCEFHLRLKKKIFLKTLVGKQICQMCQNVLHNIH